MKIVCLIICVGHDDYLAASLHHNAKHYDRTLVVSSLKDAATKRVCDHNNVECVQTDAFFRDGAAFNKGAGINVGLEHLDFQNWCVLQDADMVLPPMARVVFESVSLNEQFLYGIDRLMVPTVDHWQRFLANPLPQHECSYTFVGPFPVGVRVSKNGEWVPIGFFQMFHRQAAALTSKPFYPETSPNAASSDMGFALKWPRTHRHLLPEILGYHLATADVTYGKMGQNWEGRKTSRFEMPDQYHVNLHRPEVIRDG